MLRAPAGICETCDLVRVAGTQEANETRPRFFMPMAHHVEPQRRLLPVAVEPETGPSGNGATGPAAPEQPRTRRKYVRRKPLAEDGRRRKKSAPVGAEMTIEQLRSRYSDEHAELARQMKALEVKLEVLDEVEAAIKGGK
jgi:hypothetical protein